MKYRLICLLIVVLTLCQPICLASYGDEVNLEVTITDVPQVLADKGDLIISGTVHNSGDTSAKDVVASLWRDATPITTFHGLDLAMTAGRGGALSEAPQASYTIGEIPPGETRNFKVLATTDAQLAVDPLWLDNTNTAYRVGVEVFSSGTLAGASRLAIANPDLTQQLPTTTTVLLTTTPAIDSMSFLKSQPKLFDTDVMNKQVNETLEPLLKLAEQPDVGVIVDPNVIDQVKLLDTPEAKSWIERLKARLKKPNAYRSLYNCVDVGGLITAGDQATLDDATRTDSLDLTSDLPLFVVPQALAGSDEISGGLSEKNVSALLAANISADLLDTSGGISSSGNTILPITEAPTTPADLTALRAQQLVGGLSAHPVNVLVRSAQAAKTIAHTPTWLKLSPISKNLGTDTPNQAQWTSTLDTNYAAGLSEELDNATSRVEKWALLTDQLSQLKETLTHLHSGFWSINFKDEQARNGWLNQVLGVTAPLNDPNALAVRVTDSVTTAEKDNVLPVTIVNSMPEQIKVKVVFTSSNSQRIEIADSQLVTVAGRDQLTLRVSPQSKANGPVRLTAQLALADGELIGQPTEFTINATRIGAMGWALIIISSIILFTVTAWRVRQVRRHNKAELEEFENATKLGR